MTFGAVLQTAWLLGGEAGNAFMQTYVRMAEQTRSYLVGLHVEAGGIDVQQRLDIVGSGLGRHAALPAGIPAQSLGLLADAVRIQATVLAIIDGFAVCVMAAILALCLVALLRRP